jgi:hypothetical protein
MRDHEIRRRLEQLRPPPRRPQFEEELWERVAEREHAAARRWRRAASGLAALTLAAIASTAVVATAHGGGSTVDRSASCRLRQVGGVPGILITARPREPGIGAAGLRIETADGVPLLALQEHVTGFELDGADCSAVGGSVPLATDGLPLVGSYASGDVRSYGARCFPDGRVLLHMRLELDRSGRPRSATVAVRGETGGTLAVVRWSQDLVLAYASDACPAA